MLLATSLLIFSCNNKDTSPDVAGIKVTDASGEKLESHLKAADFLDASKFADATFEIKSVKHARRSFDNAVGEPLIFEQFIFR